jgi:hypothetical protein
MWASIWLEPLLSAGSRIWKDNVAESDSSVQRYKQAGLVISGKTNSPELGLTTTSESVGELGRYYCGPFATRRAGITVSLRRTISSTPAAV